MESKYEGIIFIFIKDAAQKIIDTYSSTLPLSPINNNEALLVRDNQVTFKSL
ncbi:hypothetical protein [Rodentibacter pneumotropicus]|uniref:hypothetical protein n=1 Tax=Rodentibacter pneumotropicus TaxID=758 RepID=UPI0013F67395|nr:hypothetical protein [Rodentibacter pneumotropicus]